MPPVSIIVPIYNSEDTIGDCIRSIVDQSFADIEIILVNDGSTDGSQQICDEYAQKDARIRVFFQENKGRSVARMNGFIHSTGEWITFVDSDDTLPRNAIELLYGKANDNTDIVFGNGYSLPNEKRTVIPIDDFRHLAIRAEGTIGVPWGSMYRRTLLSEYAFDVPRDIYNGEDYIFWLRIVFNTEKGVNIVYESVYNKGEEHTSNSFKWTSEYCYKLNEYRKNSIPSDQHKQYMPDMICDRIVNMSAVAASCKKSEWMDSEYYNDLLDDMKANGIRMSLKQRLFFNMPFLWMRRQYSRIGSIMDKKYFFFLMIIGIVMLCMNLLDSNTLSDDLVYRFMFQKDNSLTPQIIDSIGDIIQSQWNHYFIVNGRIVVHSLAQVFFAFTPPLFLQIINSILFVVLIYLSLLLVRIDYKESFFTSVLMCFLLFVVFSGFRTAMVWGLGALNYLWVLVFTIGFVIFLRYIHDRKSKVYWLLAPLSALIGCSHEGLAIPLSVAFIVYMTVNRKDFFKTPTGLYMAFYILGAALCLSSPGIIDRAGGGMSLQDRILSGIVNAVFNVRVTWLLLITLILLFGKDKKGFYREVSQQRYYYLTLVMSLGIVLTCGTNLERVAFFADFVSMLILLKIVSERLSEKYKRYAVLLCSVLMMVSFVFAFIVRLENHENSQCMVGQMEKPGQEMIRVRQPEKGTNILLDYFREHYVNPSAEFGFYCCYMGFNANDINMRMAAALYGKEKMVFIPEDVVNRIENDSNAYKHYELDKNNSLYIWRMSENSPVKRVVFKLKPEDHSQLLPHQRIVAYKGDEYVMDDDFHYSVVSIYGNPYLIFTKPTTNIFRRIRQIRYDFQ